MTILKIRGDWRIGCICNQTAMREHFFASDSAVAAAGKGKTCAGGDRRLEADVGREYARCRRAMDSG